MLYYDDNVILQYVLIESVITPGKTNKNKYTKNRFSPLERSKRCDYRIVNKAVIIIKIK